MKTLDDYKDNLPPIIFMLAVVVWMVVLMITYLIVPMKLIRKWHWFYTHVMWALTVR